MASENTSTTHTEGTDTAASGAATHATGTDATHATGGDAMAPATGDLHTSTGTADHGGGHGGTFPPFDSSNYPSQLVWLAITFGLFYYLMAKVVLPRIAQTLEQRHDRIANDLAEAEKLKGETDAAIASYEQALAEARQKAGDIARTTRDRVQKSIDSERAAAEDSLASKMADAEKHIANVKASALGEVDEIASETAQTLIGMLGGGKATKAELTKALSEVRG
ncbi:MAG: F0F1 ATP synthase subunit B [Rhodobiaceae bacterium]|nr:F0F1 ATP synthase subunit B [Rhodobiaceae bacterium]